MCNKSGNKITVIGAGAVGSTIAYTLSNSAIAAEIVLIDIVKGKAEGEAMDILQGTAFQEPINVWAGDYPDAVDSDIVIITSGVARKPGQSRIDLAQTNVNIIKSIAPEIVRYAPDAIYVIVSNPVDVLTYVFTKISGLPESQIIGSGTSLDTARLRSRLSEHFKVAQKNVHGFVFGEHGDSSFVPWSTANIAGVKLDDYLESEIAKTKGTTDLNKDEVVEYVHTSGGQIIANKGATNYAIAVSVCRLCRLILAPYESVTTVSTVLHGEYGIEDVAISILTEIGPNGVAGRLELPLTDEEKEKLLNSANVLKGVIAKLEI
jgi:L-lactate dehydrogenase